MSAINDMLARNQFTEEIDGVPFTLRRITAQMSFNIIGRKTMGIVRGARADKDVSPDDSLFLLNEVLPKYLEAAMVKPKFGPETDVEQNVVCLEDMGEFAIKVFNCVLMESGFDKLENFQPASEAMTEES